MSETSIFTVVAFDVADNKRRRRLVKVLESFGDRVQESVFEIWLTPTERRKLETRAAICINPAEDKLALYGLPAVDRNDIIILGKGELTADFTYWHL